MSQRLQERPASNILPWGGGKENLRRADWSEKTMLGMRVTISLLLGVLCAISNAFGGSQQNAAKLDDPPLKLETLLVQVPVIVSGAGGRYITDLKKGDFTIF